MSAATLQTGHAGKRPLEGEGAAENVHTAKRQRKLVTHHHGVHYRQKAAPELSLKDEPVYEMLRRSLSLALTAAGFDAADPLAVESFCAEVHEYMSHFTSAVARSMHSSRRIQPIPPDFGYALLSQKISFGDLDDFIRPTKNASTFLPPLPTPPPEDVPPPSLSSLLGPDLTVIEEEDSVPALPTHFPTFPSKHSFRATPDFPKRESDPRLIRERAMEEGRMGEEALRRLVVASAAGKRFSRTLGSGIDKGSSRQQRDQMWQRTMDMLAQRMGGPPSVSESIGGSINVERRFWRRDTRSNTRVPVDQKPKRSDVDAFSLESRNIG
ncbi:MAG: hypothetical protein M1825_006189 [Sarcosagium campestre]|nr:MAG: hypothetical protein M1825_006189 [Sarcosagium campestre]